MKQNRRRQRQPWAEASAHKVDMFVKPLDALPFPQPHPFVLVEQVPERPTSPLFRLRREVRRRFPNESHKGATSYAILRSMQLRWLRLPKRQVKIGERLPERY